MTARVAALAAIVAATACAAPPDLRVELTESGVLLDQSAVVAGHHVLAIHNAGGVVHELEVIATDLPVSALPYDPDAKRVIDVRSIAEKENIAPGATKRLAADLAPGLYALICNVPGHYSRGMRAGLTVR